jgi:hypothetical protein
MSGPSGIANKPNVDWHLKLGVALFLLSIMLPVVGVPVVAGIGLSAGMATSVSGALLVAAEILGIAAVAVMGKSGYVYLKSRISKFLKNYGPPKEVSSRRYNIGLVMFCVPLLFGWLSMYTLKWIPGITTYPFAYALIGDCLFLASLFLLGGNFWDKVRALFIHTAEAHFSERLSQD